MGEIMGRGFHLVIVLIICSSIIGCINDSERETPDSRVLVYFQYGVNITEAKIIIDSFNVTILDSGINNNGVNEEAYFIVLVPQGEEEDYINQFKQDQNISDAKRLPAPPSTVV
jgi:hypothetical protein